MVALATKHKSSNALKRYVHREDSIKVLPALKIAKSVFASFGAIFCGFVIIEYLFWEIQDSKENHGVIYATLKNLFGP